MLISVAENQMQRDDAANRRAPSSGLTLKLRFMEKMSKWPKCVRASFALFALSSRADISAPCFLSCALSYLYLPRELARQCVVDERVIATLLRGRVSAAEGHMRLQ